MKTYTRIEQQVEKTKIDEFLAKYTNDGWSIKNYQELPAHVTDYVRVIILFEKETKDKKTFL